MGKATLVSLHSLTGQAASSLPGRAFYSVSTHFVRRDDSGAMQALHPLGRPYGLHRCHVADFRWQSADGKLLKQMNVSLTNNLKCAVGTEFDNIR